MILKLIKKKVRIFLKYSRSIYLRKRGVDIGENVRVSFSAWIDFSSQSKVIIGDDVIISHGAKILAHDWSSVRLGNSDFISHFKTTTVNKNAFIGMNVIIFPGVTVGENAVVGAGAIVVKDVPPNAIVVGNPAKVVKKKD